VLGWEPTYMRRISPCLCLLLPEDAEHIQPLFFRCVLGRSVPGAEYRLRHSDGTGYVWLTEEMTPTRRHPDGRVQEVRCLSFDVTALRARELDFVLGCLRQFNFRREREILEELEVPALMARLLPCRLPHETGKIVPFRKRPEQNARRSRLEPALAPALPPPWPRRPHRRI
jgi:hypothetical protein